eukprot:gnl/TRDRNA2_/TRDRNA2_80357_c0_seq1.p1 gnl/TRDRNA2_/TRDRNA2_80357_c0~~gnl/TRDRNA2_/TRDRNA2_80357_c0_seq1.p1  ORF type:complete len:299 (-),score=60.47 gnl/TRDRNA2_/TRDRNA2_80357_c0_seq1:57-953(-)
MSKNILVTGGNTGIGFALCKLLATGTKPDSQYKTPVPPPCHVFLGSRSLERGEAAVKKILDDFPDAAGKIEVLQIDVTDDASCAAAAAALKAKDVCLYALVNNAGLGLNQEEAATADVHAILNTNYYGPKRVTEAMVKLIDPKEGRIVNTSSGGAPMYLKKQNATLKATLSNPDITFEELDKTIKAESARDDLVAKGYGFSKAALNGLTLVYAKAFPHLKVVSLSPGFIDTAMVKGWGAKLTPEQGCVSSFVCLFDEVTSGYFYGSDGLRSPFTMTRDPGMPAYEGEDDPAQDKYNQP